MEGYLLIDRYSINGTKVKRGSKVKILNIRGTSIIASFEKEPFFVSSSKLLFVC